jgi:hypothetical protein
MILIQKIKKIKVKKWILEVLLDSAFFLILSIFFVIYLLSVYNKNSEKALILRTENTKPELITKAEENTYNFVASNRGKYYYLIGSPKANTLSEKNKLYFKSSHEAEKLGFKPYISN